MIIHRTYKAPRFRFLEMAGKPFFPSHPLTRVLVRPLMFFEEYPRLVLHNMRAKYGGDWLMGQVKLEKISTIQNIISPFFTTNPHSLSKSLNSRSRISLGGRQIPASMEPFYLEMENRKPSICSGRVGWWQILRRLHVGFHWASFSLPRTARVYKFPTSRVTGLLQTSRPNHTVDFEGILNNP
jgi:hypothetical protein